MSRRTAAPALTIVEALGDPHLLGGLAAFRDLASWARWLVFLKALLGLALDPDEVAIFRHHTGRTRYTPLPGGYQTVVAVVVRQSGKTQIAAALAAWEAMMAPREPGSTGQYGLMIAQDFRGALRALFSYAAGVFDAVPLLRGTVVGRTTDTLTLRSGIVLAAYPCRPPAIRGLRARIAVLDELASSETPKGIPRTWRCSAPCGPRWPARGPVVARRPERGPLGSLSPPLRAGRRAGARVARQRPGDEPDALGRLPRAHGAGRPRGVSLAPRSSGSSGPGCRPSSIPRCWRRASSAACASGSLRMG